MFSMIWSPGLVGVHQSPWMVRNAVGARRYPYLLTCQDLLCSSLPGLSSVSAYLSFHAFSLSRSLSLPLSLPRRFSSFCPSSPFPPPPPLSPLPPLPSPLLVLLSLPFPCAPALSIFFYRLFTTTPSQPTQSASLSASPPAASPSDPPDPPGPLGPPARPCRSLPIPYRLVSSRLQAPSRCPPLPACSPGLPGCPGRTAVLRADATCQKESAT